MLRKIKLSLYILSLSVVLASCSQQSVSSKNKANKHLKYAQLFTVDQTNQDYTKITVLDPWNNQTIHSTYYLVRKENTETPQDGMKIRIPIQSVMVNSATHLGFISLLNEIDKVKGICNSKYVYNSEILQQVKAGKIRDLGDSFNLNTEQLLMLNPEIIFTTAYNGDKSESEKLTKLNQKPVFNLEWQEASLLGRAEWIKFIALFFDKKEKADSIFNEIENNYLKAKDIVEHTTEKPTVLSGQDFRGTWSLPAGNSYAAQLFRDAKLDYFYQNEKSFQGSIPLSIEEALVYFHKADFWVNVQAKSLDELAQENEKYKLFDAFKNKRIYNNNKRSNHLGGNDYWETGVARPDLLLKDLIKIAHPTLLPDYELYFMQKLDRNNHEK